MHTLPILWLLTGSTFGAYAQTTLDVSSLAASSSATSSAVSDSFSVSIGTPSASNSVSSVSSSVVTTISTTANSTATATTNSTATATTNSTATATTNSTATATTDSTAITASQSTTFSAFPTPSQAAIPGVFPATDPSKPPAVGSRDIPDFAPAWASAYKKAKAKIAPLTLEEKVTIVTGVGWTNGRCVGNIPAIGGNATARALAMGDGIPIGTIQQSARRAINESSIEPDTGDEELVWPGLCLEDSPLGVRFGDFVTAFPTGVNTAATWNRELIRRRGLYMGREFKGKGVNVALGPMMNLGRVASGGRNWEGFGADPFLAGEAAYETILGMQEGGTQACAKHFINNEQEFRRTTTSSNVDDRTQHEIYAAPFLRSVMAGVASVMCSYNLINNTYACENDKMLNDVLKREFGFQGYIMSDWQAHHSTLAAMAGLDMSMPGDIVFNSGTSWWGANLTAFVRDGRIPESRVDDMATRIVGAWYLLAQDSPSFPAVNFDAFRPDNEATNEHVNVQANHHTVGREIAAASTVLLKNVNKALPLGGERSIVLVGSDAGPPRALNEFSDQGGSNTAWSSGVLAMGWGSGTTNFTYLVSPLEAIQRRAREDSTSVSWFFDDFRLEKAGNVVIGKSAALVFVNSDSGEDYITVDGNEGDRKNLTAWHNGDNLIAAVAAQNNNTIVIVHSVGPLIVEPWIDHPNITAVVWAGVSGSETGNGLVDVLYGDWNPSGRLPYTIAKDASDYIQIDKTGNDVVKAVDYTEGLLIDYRWFDAKNITPRYEFGYGLSYTTFAYSGLQVSTISQADSAETDLEKAWLAGKASPIAEGSSAALWLHRPYLEVSFKVKNTGSLFGGEIPQLYVNFPAASGEPPSVLKGFTNVEISSKQTKTVSITLSRYDLSIWDVTAQGWRKPEGTIGVTIGASSRDSRLNGKLL